MGNNQVLTLVHHLSSYDTKKKARRTISAMEALGMYRICSLSSRMCELARRYPNVTVVKETKFDLTGKRYVRYGIA